MKIRTSTSPLFVAILAASTAFAPSALAKGQSDDQPPPAAPQAGAPETAAPTTAAPSSEPGNAGPAGGATISVTGPSIGAKDTTQSAAQAPEQKESKLPFRGSIFFFDQSMSTQTAHLEWDPQQSYIPLYEWWFSFRPQYHFNEHFYVWARFDLTKEMTNNQETNLLHEDVFGDTWTDLRYTTAVPSIDKNFKLTTALRFIWPTSKESQAIGMYVTPAISQSVGQKFNINGESAKFLNDFDLRLNVTYQHPFTRATTAANTNIVYYGMQSFSADHGYIGTDQMSGQMLTNHQLLAAVHGGLQITPKLALGLDFIWIDQWHYTPASTVDIPIQGGVSTVNRASDDTNFTQKTWLIANVDYDLFDEMSLGLGYYNLASELAPNGQRRGVIGGDTVLWSPDARVFFDVTFNLDKIYELASGQKKKEPSQAASLGRRSNNY